tara:strand:- start:770 stop:1300 length:531 start_codon:yes stop_codon:yes gene_type:complete
LYNKVMEPIIIDVNIFEEFSNDLSEVWIEKIALNSLRLGLLSLNSEFILEYHSLGITIADDITIQGLNNDYRGLNEITDVLAFSENYPGEYYGESEKTISTAESFPNETGYAGEIVLSYPQCKRQAEENKISINKELATLVSHGVLHLIGYDHTNDNELKIMEQIQIDSIKHLLDT